MPVDWFKAGQHKRQQSNLYLTHSQGMFHIFPA